MVLSNLFRKNKEEANLEEDNEKEKKKTISLSENANSDIVLLSTELEKVNASIEALKEFRQIISERLNEITERIGELRAMILERDRTIQEIELKVIKSTDLVESVQPEKLMAEVQKQNVKVEIVKANLESNETRIEQLLEELRDVRRKIEMFSNLEEIVKLSEEIKKDLIGIKKIEGKVESESAKVETIFLELKRKMEIMDKIENLFAEQKAVVEQNSKDIDFIKVKLSGLVEREELEKISKKVQLYENSLEKLKNKSSFSKDLEELKIILDSLK